MCFPIGDDNTGRATIPYVVYALIGINLLVWVALQGMSSASPFSIGYAAIPYELTHNVDLVDKTRVMEDGGAFFLQQYPGPTPIYFTLLSAMFMHGSWMHILGNMLYLWIFGDQIEDLLGHVKFLIFYLVCGVVASAAHVLVSADSVIPSLGASGAIAGVLGAYLVKYPRNTVRVFALRFLTTLPAFVVLGGWILIQIFSQIGVADTGGGVAYMAHIGGFVAGVVLVFLFGRKKAAELAGAGS